MQQYWQGLIDCVVDVFPTNISSQPLRTQIIGICYENTVKIYWYIFEMKIMINESYAIAIRQIMYGFVPTGRLTRTACQLNTPMIHFNAHIMKSKYQLQNIGMINKRQIKPKGQSRKDNLKTLATLGTQDTGRIQAKHKKHNNTRKTKKMSTWDCSYDL